MRGFHVLLVDDNFVFNMETCEFLQERGFDVEATYNADAAMAAIDRAERLSGLVTDIDLGPGPDGFAVARYARSRHPHVPVVYVSASPDRSPARPGGRWRGVHRQAPRSRPDRDRPGPRDPARSRLIR